MPKSILIVDDEPYIGYLVKMVLGRSGYNVVLALNAEEALSSSAEHDFDLFLLDIAMPGMDGLELCRTLRAQPGAAAVPVVMLTARGDEKAKVEALHSGALEFITKPFSPKALQKRVEEIIGGPDTEEPTCNL